MRTLTAAFRAFAISGDAHCVIPIEKAFRFVFIFRVNDLSRQSIVHAFNVVRRESHRALPICASTIYPDALRCNHICARVGENAILHVDDIALDQYVTRLF